MRVLFLLLATALTGCNSTPGFQASDPGYQRSDAAKAFAVGPIRFLSWNGEWNGTDVDTELEFTPDGKVTITHYGSGMDSIRGAYTTNGDTVSIDAPWNNLVEMPGGSDWPALLLRDDGASLYLFPSRKTDALEYGARNNRAAWPLKQIADKDAEPNPSGG